MNSKVILTIIMNKINSLIDNFSLNVVVASAYELHSLINKYSKKQVSNSVLRNIMTKFFTILIPFYSSLVL